MQSTIGRVIGDARTWVTLLALAAAVGAANLSVTHPAEANATALTATGTIDVSATASANAKSQLKAMSDYMAAQKAFHSTTTRTSRSSPKRIRSWAWPVQARWR